MLSQYHRYCIDSRTDIAMLPRPSTSRGASTRVTMRSPRAFASLGAILIVLIAGRAVTLRQSSELSGTGGGVGLFSAVREDAPPGAAPAGPQPDTETHHVEAVENDHLSAQVPVSGSSAQATAGDVVDNTTGDGEAVVVKLEESVQPTLEPTASVAAHGTTTGSDYEEGIVDIRAE